MEKTFWGLSKVAITICVGVPCIIQVLAFINSGELNLIGTFFMIVIMIGFAKLIMFIFSKVKKR
jgi:hypothetical protein